MKNVLFVLIDALYAKQIGFYGRRPSATPALDELLSDSLSFTRIYTVGCPTQFALPGILTSTLPLDAGGYEYGIRDRRHSLVEAFETGGYHTVGFVSGFGTGRLFGCDRGFDEFWSLYDLSLPLDNFDRLYLAYYLRLIRDGSCTLDAAADKFEPFVGQFLEFLERYCREKLTEVEGGDLIVSPFVHDWDFALVLERVQHEKRAFRSRSGAYVRDLLGERRSLSQAVAGTVDGLAKLRSKATTARYVARNLWRTLSGLAARRMRVPADAIKLLAKHKRRVASSAYVIENYTRWLERRSSSRPYFAWLHLMDVHDHNFWSFDVTRSGTGVAAETDRLLEFCGLEGASSYDLSVRYVDHQLSQLVDYLRSRDLLDDTIIVLASDHGSRDAGPVDAAPVDIVDFAERLYHCLFAIVASGVEPRTVDTLSSTLDLGPTLLDFVQLEAPSSFRGSSLLEVGAERPPVVMEHLGRGPFDPVHKPARVAVMTEDYKIVYEQSLFGDDDGRLVEAYSMSEQPDVRLDVAAARSDQVTALVAVARRRIEEVRRGLSRR